MPFLSVLRSVGVAAAVLLSASACSSHDAANEAPVDPAPGEYRVTMAGGGLATLSGFGQLSEGPGGVDDRICVSDSDGGDLADMLARKYLAFADSCSLKAKARQGNAVGGMLSCPTNQQAMPGTTFVVDYQGAIAAERVDLQSKIRIELPESALANMDPAAAQQMEHAKGLVENMEISVAAERVGECG